MFEKYIDLHTVFSSMVKITILVLINVFFFLDHIKQTKRRQTNHTRILYKKFKVYYYNIVQ